MSLNIKCSSKFEENMCQETIILYKKDVKNMYRIFYNKDVHAPLSTV